MDTKDPLNPVSEGSHNNYVTVDHFINYIVTVPPPEKIAQYALSSRYHHWILKFGPP